MSVSREKIIAALRLGGKDDLSAEQWKWVLEQYPYSEVAIWHYLRELYRGEDVAFDKELDRLSISIGDRQGFYLFMTQQREERRLFDYNVSANDYFASQGIGGRGEEMTLSEMARRLKSARLAAKESAFCKEEGEKNDIGRGSEMGKEGSESMKKVVSEGEKEGTERGELGLESKEEMSEDSERLRVIQAEVTELIQRKKYLEALEILRREKGENSKKSCYFAVQIRYLETIINNR